MHEVNANELIEAGYTFTIEDANCERQFEESGELRGIEHDMSGYSYLSPEVEEYLTISEDDPELFQNSVDDNSLSDDSNRWSHERDSYLEHREKIRRLYRSLNTEVRDWREMQHMAAWREQRYQRLLAYAGKCNPRQLMKLKRGVWKRYVQTVKACARTKAWWALYLTKSQVNNLMEV